MIQWLFILFVVPAIWTYIYVDPVNYPIAAWVAFWYWIVFFTALFIHHE